MYFEVLRIYDIHMYMIFVVIYIAFTYKKHKTYIYVFCSVGGADDS